MIRDSIFQKFPKPDLALCYHVSAELPAGTIGYFPGAIFAGVNSAEITVYGRGGHGALPHATIDLFWLGGVSQKKYNDHIENGTNLPPLHSSSFVPDFDPAFKCGSSAMTRNIIDLLRNKE